MTPPRSFKEPVAWLFGPQQIGSLKGVIMHTLYKQLDLRDWMAPGPPLEAATICADLDPAAPFWFDYLADTGDGQAPTYAVAYLCSGDLVIDGDGPTSVRVRAATEAPVQGELLPCGSVILVGGDTAYHIADDITLKQRFVNPFQWARADLVEDGKYVAERARPLLAIPGNHDYYDMLDGFNRQFRSPISASSPPKIDLRIAGLELVQEASYFALELPHDWWLFAVDTDRDQVDFRQAEYFRKLGITAASKVILVTPTPTTVFDVRPEAKAEIISELEQVVSIPAAIHEPPRAIEDHIAPGGCRLDLSGNVHHYARYWGSPATDKPADAPSSAHYASVVSGLGGAFHHPSSTRLGELSAQRKFPRAETSKAVVGRQLFHPFAIVRGGYIGTVGALIAALVTYAIIDSDTHTWFVDEVLQWFGVVATKGPGEVTGTGKHATAALFVFLGSMVMVGCFVFGAVLGRAIYQRDPDAGKLAYLPCFGIGLAGIVVMTLALRHASSQASGGVAFDVVFYYVVTVLAVGLLALALDRGRAGRKGARVTIAFVLVGALHLIMQTLPIALMVKLGSGWAGVAFIAIMLVMWLVGWVVVRSHAAWSPHLMLGLWITQAVLLLAAPFVLRGAHAPRDLPALETIVLVGFVLVGGFVNCCAQFAWYLAVSFGYHGHNNEVGGATRLDNYAQFIRFKVTRTEITGYVIGVVLTYKKASWWRWDRRFRGAELRPELIDRFTLTPR